MLPVQVALVDKTQTIPAADLAEAAGAFNEQLKSDVSRHWPAAELATVGVYPDQSVPPNTWRIDIEATMDQPGALGYHADSNRQPYAKVLKTDDWSTTVSHELLEMICDPWGNRMHPSRIPVGIQPTQVGLEHGWTRVHYLLEVCDPPESTSYEIGGVEVSDFLTKEWYRTHPSPGDAFSHTGVLTQARQVASGGYVSFATADGTWWQVFNEGSLTVTNLGKFDKANFASLREFTDYHSRMHRKTS